MQSPPKRIGVDSFAFGDVIGEGAFSKVVMARLKDSGEYYAIKILKKVFVMKEGKEKAVMAERDALTTLNHPFIIKLFFSFQDSQSLYFVMNLCRGGSLWDVIRTIRLPGRGCDPQVIHFYMAELVDAVNYLHNTAHLIHRDLKPENILISDNGHLMLSDFGTITTSNNENTSRRGTLCGTILYISPETIEGAVPTYKADVWSLGCIMYLLYTGCFLFEGEDEMNVLDSIQHFCVDMLEFPGYVPDVVVDLIKRMLHFDPNQRISIGEIMKHRYFDGIDFDALPHIMPPYVPPYVPLPVIYDDALQNELNALRGSIDESYRKEEEERKEAIHQLLKENDQSLYSSVIIHHSSVVAKKRILVLSSERRIYIMDNTITTVKSVFEASELAKVELVKDGFYLYTLKPKRLFRFSTPNKDESVWYNCILHLLQHK